MEIWVDSVQLNSIYDTAVIMRSVNKVPEAKLPVERSGFSEEFQMSVAAGWNWFTWGRQEIPQLSATYVSCAD